MEKEKEVQCYVFILKLMRNSRKNAGKITYYTGITLNPAHRLKEFRSGIGCEWIRRLRLSSIGYVYMQKFSDPWAAKKLKRKIKHMNLKEKEYFIDEPFRRLKEKLDTTK